MNANLPELSFRIKNLGPVRYGVLTHKPLTIICGPNNAGKTWAMYALYSFYKLTRMYAIGLRGTDDTLFPPVDVINDVMTDALPSSFNVADFPAQDVKFELIPGPAWEKDLETAAKSGIFFMPAERNGLQLLFRELSARRTTLLHRASRSVIDLNELLKDVKQSRYTEPVADYIDWLNGLIEIRNSRQQGFHRYAERLKRRIARGAYRVDHITGDIEFTPYRSKGSEERPATIALHISSSSVKSLFGLWFYLEYQASPGSICMIDEPELSMHPANQRLVARLLARLVNAGVSVVISTHSDYMIREFNSLIMLSQSGGRTLRKRYGYDADEVIAPEKVAAYLFDRQTITPFDLTHEDGIHATTFDDVITDLNIANNDIYFGIRQMSQAENND